MKHKDLNFEEIKKILAPTPREIGEKRVSNPFDECKGVLRNTVNDLKSGYATRSECIIMGRLFEVVLLPGDIFRVKPVNGFVPMGTFPLRWLNEGE